MTKPQNLIRVIVLAAVYVALFGCTSGPKYEDVAASISPTPPEQARIVIFRDSTFGTGRENMRVTINGATVGYLPLGSVLMIDHSPGLLQIHVEKSGIFRDGKVDVSLSARAGNEYYYQLGPSRDCDMFLFGVVPCYVQSKVGMDPATSYCGQGLCLAPRTKDKALSIIDKLAVQSPASS